MNAQRRLRLIAPAAQSAFLTAMFVLLLARLILVFSFGPALHAGPIENSGSWALLTSAAIVGACALGGACLWHASVLARLTRIRLVDACIAGLGVCIAALWGAIAWLAVIEPSLARTVLALASPIWVAGLGTLVLAGTIALYVRRSRFAEAPRTVLILGAGLRGREVGPLLRRRVDLGAEVWRAAISTRPDARIIVAGGQGPDEVRTEASAMAEYLVREKRVPADAIDLEEQSTSTRENLRYSKTLSPKRPVAVVTSDYHAYRTAWLLVSEDLDAEVVPAHTRRSYLPGATVREALAVAISHPVISVASVALALGLSTWLLEAT